MLLHIGGGHNVCRSMKSKAEGNVLADIKRQDLGVVSLSATIFIDIWLGFSFLFLRIVLL